PVALSALIGRVRLEKLIQRMAVAAGALAAFAEVNELRQAVLELREQLLLTLALIANFEKSLLRFERQGQRISHAVSRRSGLRCGGSCRAAIEDQPVALLVDVG